MTSESVTAPGLWQLFQAAETHNKNAADNVLLQVETGVAAIGKLMFSASECEQYPVNPQTTGEIGELLQLLSDLAALTRYVQGNATFAELSAAKARIAELEASVQ